MSQIHRHASVLLCYLKDAKMLCSFYLHACAKKTSIVYYFFDTPGFLNHEYVLLASALSWWL